MRANCVQAFLINPHGWKTEAFEVISSAFTKGYRSLIVACNHRDKSNCVHPTESFDEMRAPSKEDRSSRTRRILSFAIDAIEESFEDEADFPHAFVKASVSIAETFLGLRDPVTLKLWLLR